MKYTTLNLLGTTGKPLPTCSDLPIFGGGLDAQAGRERVAALGASAAHIAALTTVHTTAQGGMPTLGGQTVVTATGLDVPARPRSALGESLTT
ncbi:hypothetical protein [Actinokineospora bangkokensis]|uniref:Uncharacterized protein n=1 Tax=Actinokineospora bangkokensis TaxID=1193682 RepID=A0A1Q9LDY4_9PSEU|nr:hypothetical protein [Actinokineospora bangkokensis]OLR90224.1 hypothetical protein BJP25_04515 [Actinokineospora bangkokensis]